MDIRWQFCYPIKLISKSFYPNLMLEAIILIWVYSILQIKKQIDWNRKYILVKKKNWIRIISHFRHFGFSKNKLKFFYNMPRK